MPPRPPERIDLGDVVLVRDDPSHAEPLADAIGRSLEHLAPFMPWADAEAATLGFQRRRLTEGHPKWDGDEEYVLLLLDPTETEVLGGAGLHRRAGPECIEIGYWLRVDQTGKGLMTRAARALTEVGLGLDGIERVEIRTDLNNRASAAIPQRLGFDLQGSFDRDVVAPGEAGIQQVWVTGRPASG